MERNVLNRAADYNKKRRKKVRRYKMFTVLAAVVVFCTTYSLIMPAITMETPQCGLEEHTHGSDCYDTKLVCTQEESGHTHGDGCYTVTTTRELTCSQEEGGAVEGHTHSDACYTVTQTPRYRTETVEHTREVTEVTGQDEEGNPITESRTETYTEEVQVEDGYDETRELTCGQSECEAVEGHTHDDSCYTEVEHKELTCTEEETGHTHGEDCYEKTLICTLTEHTHDASCYPEEDNEEKPPVEGEEGEEKPPVEGEEGEEKPPVEGEEGEEKPPVEGEEGEETPPAETMKPVRVDEEGYILDENGDRVLDENGDPIKAEATAPVEPPEEEVPPEEVVPPEQIGAVRVDDEGYLLDENGERVLDENGNPILVEIPDVEVPTTLMMTVLPAGAEVPENYTETYNYADSEGEYAVTVFAPEGAVPADAELSATVMWGVRVENEDGGVVPMDIHFELNGEEIEPVLPVYVVINVENLIPEDADPESVEIQHYKGTDYEAADAVQISALAAGINLDSGIMALDLDEEPAVMDEAPVMELPEDVEVVANSEAGTGVVDVNSEVMKAAFEVGEFSYFTITYKNNSANNTSLGVIMIRETGDKNNVGYRYEDIGSYNNLDTNIGVSGNYALTDGEWHPLSIIVDALGINTYTYRGTVYEWQGYAVASNKANGYGGSHLTEIRYDVATRKWQLRNGPDGNEFTMEETTTLGRNRISYIHLVYRENPQDVRQDAYFYVLKPQNNGVFTWDSHKFDEGGSWYYAGEGKVSLPRMTNSAINYKFNESQVITYPRLPNTYTDPTTGITYYLKGSAAADGKEYLYRVEWTRFKSADGTHNNNTAFGDNNRPNGMGTPSGKIWHVDGILVLEPSVTVNYYILDVDGKPISGIGDNNGNVAYEVIAPHEKLSGDLGSAARYSNELYEEYTKGGTDFISNTGTITKWYTEDGQEWNFDTSVGAESFNLYAYLKPKPPQTYTLDLVKYSGHYETKNGEEVVIMDEDVPLSGAVFEIVEVENSEKTTSTADGHKGHISWDNLKFGELYTLREVTSPNGYNPLIETITFKVNDDGTKEITGEAAKYAQFSETGIQLKVANIGGYVLPSTGGEGIYWYAWSGALLMMAAAFTLMYKKSYRREGLED